MVWTPPDYRERYNEDGTRRHAPMRQQDEYYCARCNKRWAVGESAPDYCIE